MLASVPLITFLMSDNAQAMHISEGILPLPWAVLWFVAAAPFVMYGIFRLKRLSQADLSFKPFVGLLAAVVFILSCLPVPVPTAGTCSHPGGTGISAILVGPSVSVVIALVALLIQALFLAHGGLSTLGANVVSMGIAGSFAGYAVFRLARFGGLRLPIAGFLAGFFADWATYLATSVELASGIRGSDAFVPLLWMVALAFVPTQLPLAVLEGAMTSGMVMLLMKKRPDLLVKMQVLRAGEAAR
jgi:cobalt/nickel transport system permease protein